MAAHSISLKITSSPYITEKTDGQRLRIEACAGGLSDKIFAYRMLPVDVGGGQAAYFSHVCSSVDLAEYPEDAPVPGHSPQWLRVQYVDVLVRSTAEADDFLAVVKQDVATLVASLDRQETLENETVFSVGPATCFLEDPASSSSSSAASSSSESYGAVQTLTTTGTIEQFAGIGVAWTFEGVGGGSPVGSSDSMAANLSRVSLAPGEASQLLSIAGFELSAIPADAEIVGITWGIVIKTDAESSESSASSLSEETCPQLVFTALQHSETGLGDNQSANDCLQPYWQTLMFGAVSGLSGLLDMSGQQLRASSLGVGLVVVVPQSGDAVTVDVDGVVLTVYYRSPA